MDRVFDVFRKNCFITKLSPSFYSLAYPAAWLLFGMLFTQVTAYFMTIPWSQFATATVYTVALVWVLVLAWRGRRHVWPATIFDGLFVGFVLLASASFIFQGGSIGGAEKFARYLPFMVVVPYFCGRLMLVSDIAFFMRIVLVAGMVLLPLLLTDRLTSPGRDAGRWPFFGLDHGALLAGALLAVALIVLCVRILDCRDLGERKNRRNRSILYGLIGLTTVFLVWVTARGFLLASFVGIAVACLSARYCSFWKRVGLLAAILMITGLSFLALPKLDPYFGRFYALPMDMGSYTEPITFLGKAEPILGEASCEPFKEGNNSVAMRWVLYQEAMAMFVAHPYLGVGAARFGAYSCAGPGGFPHSIILQGFAELGLVGGGLLVGLFALAAVTLVRPLLPGRQGPNWSEDAFILALFAAFLVECQIYGNYFMSAGAWLILGIAASMQVNSKHGGESRD